MTEIAGFESITVLTALLIGLVSYMIWRKQHSQCNYPPGPFSFPIIGNLPQIAFSGSLHSFLHKSRRKFGNVFSIEFGGAKQVVVSGYDNIYNLLVKDADFTSNRSSKGMPAATESLSREKPGIVWAPFPHWKLLRTFALNVLREEGMGSQSLENKILYEADEFCKCFIEPNLGQSINLTQSLAKATNNIISEMIFGGRTEYNEPKFGELIDAMMKFIRSTTNASVTKNLPFLKYFQLSWVQDTKRLIELLCSELEMRLEKRKEVFDVNNPVNIFDEFLIHRQKENVDNKCFNDGNAVVMAEQIYVAGSESTSTALRWAFLYTCLHPDTKLKVQQEIHDVIGSDRTVRYSDRNSLHYTSAVLLETLRLANIVPAGLPHVLDKDMVVDGKKIPAGSILMFYMASVLHDEEIFDNPERFCPERYLTGDVKLKLQHTIPFGAGRRICLGESLARMEFFLFYVSLMQKYDMKLPEGKEYSTEPLPSIINAPQPYEIIFTKRN